MQVASISVDFLIVCSRFEEELGAEGEAQGGKKAEYDEVQGYGFREETCYTLREETREKGYERHCLEELSRVHRKIKGEEGFKEERSA